jgi:hypothetical protein
LGEGFLVVDISFTVDTSAFKASLDQKAAEFETAFSVALNMIASMMEKEISLDIRNSGKFGDEYLENLSVEVEGNTITATLDDPNASIFETGGTINGNPLLWLPISGTDAEGIQASNYGDQLFSVNRVAGGVPLLFSVKDRAPKYFGVPSVTIPKKFHIAEIVVGVMQEFPSVLKDALNE